MTKYISAFAAAKIIGVSRQTISKRIQRGTFIRGYIVVDKRLQTKQLRFKMSDILDFKNSRHPTPIVGNRLASMAG